MSDEQGLQGFDAVNPSNAPINPGGNGWWMREGERERAPVGSRTMALVGWIATALLFLVLVFVPLGPRALTAQAKPGVSAGAVPAVKPPEPGNFLTMSRLAVTIVNKLREIEQSQGGAFIASMRTEYTKQFVHMLDEGVSSPEERLRLAIVRGELQDGEAALNELAKLPPTGNPPDLQSDIAMLKVMYASGLALAPDQVRALTARHGFYGELAGAYPLASGDPARLSLIKRGNWILDVLGAWAAFFIFAFFAGIVLLIVAGVMLLRGKLRPRFAAVSGADEPGGRGWGGVGWGGSVPIETVALFLAGFVVLEIVVGQVVAAYGGETGRWCALLLQWALASVVLWPWLRGGRGGGRLVGHTSGRGVLKEIGCGVAGYVAMVPIQVAGVIVTLIIFAIESAVRAASNQPPAPSPANKMAESVASFSPAMLVVFVALATLWAPLVEETIFRGGLYRQIRTRWPWWVAAIITACMFAGMHSQYPIEVLPVLAAMGFAMAMVREWRGSLIASMTMHFMQNSFVTALLIAMMAFAKS